MHKSQHQLREELLWIVTEREQPAQGHVLADEHLRPAKRRLGIQTSERPGPTPAQPGQEPFDQRMLDRPTSFTSPQLPQADDALVG